MLEVASSEGTYRVDSTLASRKSGGLPLGSDLTEVGAKTYTSSGTAGQQHPDRQLFAIFLGKFAFAELICSVEPGTLDRYDTRL